MTNEIVTIFKLLLLLLLPLAQQEKGPFQRLEG